MQTLLRAASVLGCAVLLLASHAAQLSAQSAVNPTAEALRQMRVDVNAKAYVSAIARGNGLLESARAISADERRDLWELLAAAYYPETAQAQQPDSARLPLEALIRITPDFKIARALSWSGLDELTERVRAESFAVVTRPLSSYTVSASRPAHITVVASRPTVFRLYSTDEAGDRIVLHDSSPAERVAVLQLRTHDERGPVFTDGTHQLVLMAYDASTGDSLRIEHRVRALRFDLPSLAPDAGSASSATRASPSQVEPAPLPVSRNVRVTRRTPMLVGGLALAAVTALLAQDARPNDALRSSFTVDARAFVVCGAMVSAAVANLFAQHTRPRAAAPRATVNSQQEPARLPAISTYQVRLDVDPPER